jgi:hypothetical protein
VGIPGRQCLLRAVVGCEPPGVPNGTGLRPCRMCSVDQGTMAYAAWRAGRPRPGKFRTRTLAKIVTTSGKL